jgi:hypothetical protein
LLSRNQVELKSRVCSILAWEPRSGWALWNL